MYRTIELKDLLVYSSIYGLGLTDQDKLHLEAMDLLYKGKCNGRYIYKPTSKSFDLCLQFNDDMASNNGNLTLVSTDKMAIQHGYPLFKLGDHLYLKTLPSTADIKHLSMIADEFTREEFLCSTADEVKQKFLTTVLPTRSHHSIDREFIEACFWAHGTLGTSKATILDTTKKEFATLPNYVRRIIAVLQLADDTRFAFFAVKTGYGGWNPGYDVQLGHYSTHPGDPTYNYTDVGNYFSHIETGNIPRVIYTDQTMAFPKEEAIIGGYRQGKAFLTIDASTLETLTRRWMRKQQEAAAEATAIKQLESKIKSKIEELKKNSTFTYNDMTFYQDRFEYENQTLQDANVTMQQVLGQFYGNYSEERLNFDNVFDVWLAYVVAELKKKKTSTGKIGDVDYKLVLKTTTGLSKTTGRSTETNSFYINDYKINRDEVTDVLKRALCFPDTVEFENFCESVAACSLEYHKLIAGGILISAHDEIFDETLEFKIELERNKRRNSVVVGDKKWLIHNTTKLLSVAKAGSMARVISVLLDPDVIGMTGDEIKSLMDLGKKALVDQRNRDEELLKSTMEMFGIEKVEEVACTNGKVLSGYLIHGKLRDYIVEERKCMVFEHPTGRYLCMVDKGQNEHTNTARLVNRFFALSNDSKLATEITTL